MIKSAQVLSVMLLSCLLATAQAQQPREPEREPNVRTERTAALRETTFKRLSKARELAEAGNHADAIKLLEGITDDRRSNGYEKAQAWNLVAYCHYESGDTRQALAAYEQVLAQDGIPASLRTATQYAMAQMYMATEQWARAARSLEDWFEVTENPGSNAYLLLGQAYFQMKEYKKARQPIEKAVADASAKGEPIKENWLLLLRSIYYQDGDFPRLLGALKQLAGMYPKREYWLQLSAVYGELDEPKKQLATMLAAYDQGYFERGQDYVGLAQLLMGSEVPFKAAQVLQEGLDNKLVEVNALHLRMLADAYVIAKDYEQAAGVLARAVKVVNDGETELRLAQVHMERSDWAEAAAAARRAIQKGGLKRPDIAHVVLGLALYEQNQLPAAQAAFAQAARDERSKSVAEQWQQYIAREQERMRAIAAFGAG